MPSPDTPLSFSEQEPALTSDVLENDIDYLNHSRALARQQQATRPEQLHYTLESSDEVISHW